MREESLDLIEFSEAIEYIKETEEPSKDETDELIRLIDVISKAENMTTGELAQKIAHSIKEGVGLEPWLTHLTEQEKIQKEREKKSMIIYLSGPISGRLFTYKAHFQKVYDALTAAGHAVISPHFLPIGLKKEQDYLNIAHENLKAAEAIYLLEGWQDSPGAKTELKWAIDMQKRIFLENDKDSEAFLKTSEVLEI